mmetsp:Transcript_23184/g.62862  ORF Transcript_23184/g.62862 Transcript_23184/m.62862 type:complete len:237 (+) Transcript_23184:50-760(+)
MSARQPQCRTGQQELEARTPRPRMPPASSGLTWCTPEGPGGALLPSRPRFVGPLWRSSCLQEGTHAKKGEELHIRARASRWQEAEGWHQEQEEGGGEAGPRGGRHEPLPDPGHAQGGRACTGLGPGPGAHSRGAGEARAPHGAEPHQQAEAAREGRASQGGDAGAARGPRGHGGGQEGGHDPDQVHLAPPPAQRCQATRAHPPDRLAIRCGRCGRGHQACEQGSGGQGRSRCRRLV